MKKIYLLILTILVANISIAQRWKNEKLSIFAAVGTNQFMGDLGGGAKDAAHFLGIRDMDFEYTRPTFQAGIRYRILKDLSVKPTISYAYLKADDASSNSVGRKARNLSFSSNVWEAGVQFEYSFIPEKELARYTFSSLRATKKISAYVLVGAGGLYFNPKAELNGVTYELRPLNTEGQGQASYTYEGQTYTPDKPYGSFAAFFSIGLGARYAIDRRWGLGIEISNRYTTTDYLDDVHNRYYTTGSDPIANEFADRRLEYTYDEFGVAIVSQDPAAPRETGYPLRGQPEYKDAYIFTNITGYFKLKSTLRSMPKF
jgi:hypothetical protein